MVFTGLRNCPPEQGAKLNLNPMDKRQLKTDAKGIQRALKDRDVRERGNIWEHLLHPGTSLSLHNYPIKTPIDPILPITERNTKA